MWAPKVGGVDLFSAAQRFARPFIAREGHRAEDWGIGAHGAIGDGHTCALVRVDGAIDWLCFPRFDSPSVFGAVLDAERGGVTALTPVARPFESLQRYDPDTNVLETLFRVPDRGVVRLTDFMPWTDDGRASPHEVHRRVECVEGEVELEVVFDPRFAYGVGATRLTHGARGVLAEGPSGERLAAAVEVSGWRDRPRGGVEGRVVLRRGERRWMILSYHARSVEPIASYRPFEHLRQTRRAWRQWTQQIHYDGPWRHHVVRAALAMKLLTYAPTGAMVAAATASLPEWIGGTRNWDYRYAWARDAAMSVRAQNLVGCAREAREFFYFARDCLDTSPELRVMYAIDGGEVPAEQQLSHLRGFAGSGPVRIGNGARHQLQLDAAGSLVDAAYLYERGGGSLTLRTWRHLRDVVERLREQRREPDDGIWEPRAARAHNVDSQVMCWVALERGARIAALFGDQARHDAWLAEAAAIHASVTEHGVDASGAFVASYGGSRTDAALLRLPIHGFLPATDPRVERTVARVRHELADGLFLRRYHGATDDGVGGPEGAFILCGLWLAETLALSGRLDEALDVFVAHAESSNHVGLLAEMIDPASGALLGNFPQAFSHLGLVNAAVRIDRALRRRDEVVTTRPSIVP